MFPDAKVLKKRRKLLNLTQTQLAKLSGISQSLIAKLESGKIDPAYSKIKKIIQTLDKIESKDVRKAKSVMIKKIVNVSINDKVKKAVDLMHKKAISQVPIFDRGVPVGSILEKTITKFVAEGKSIKKILNMKVKEIMEESFPTVSEETPIDILSSLLNINQAVLVTKRDKVIGIVTRSDLF